MDELWTPGVFARLLLASEETAPRSRARDQQADLEGEAVRRRILRRLASEDNPDLTIEAMLQKIVNEAGEADGPIRGACSTIWQEWTLACQHPGYRAFLVGRAVLHGARADKVEGQRLGRESRS